MNVWRFRLRFFEACRCVPTFSRGELELPLAVQEGITSLGMRLKVIRLPRRRARIFPFGGDIASVTERLRAIEPSP